MGTEDYNVVSFLYEKCEKEKGEETEEVRLWYANVTETL